MKKQNYLSALTYIFLSLTCFVVGYWVGEGEKKEIEKNLLSNVESTLKNSASRTLSNLKLLVALKEGNEDIAVKILTTSVKSGLSNKPNTGHIGVDYLVNLSSPSEETKLMAIEYQTKYCVNKCLGM